MDTAIITGLLSMAFDDNCDLGILHDNILLGAALDGSYNPRTDPIVIFGMISMTVMPSGLAGFVSGRLHRHAPVIIGASGVVAFAAFHGIPLAGQGRCFRWRRFLPGTLSSRDGMLVGGTLGGQPKTHEHWKLTAALCPRSPDLHLKPPANYIPRPETGAYFSVGSGNGTRTVQRGRQISHWGPLAF